MNVRAVLALLAVILIGVAVWILKGPTTPPEVADSPVAPTQVAKAPPVEPAQAPIAATPSLPTTPPEPLPPPLPRAPELSDADRKIDEILRANPDNSDAANTATAQMLINLLPTLKPDGQAEAAQHISNLISDKEYGRVRALVTNASAPQEVIDVFVTDLMNRDDAVKLPVLLDIAKIPNHPAQEEALTDLQIFLDGDFGTDWLKWDRALKDYLKKQQEELAPPPTAAPAR
jgi:hypothetical protein